MREPCVLALAMSRQVKLLEDIAASLKDLNKRVQALVDQQEKMLGHRVASTPKALSQEEPLDAFALMELPDHLRRTALAMYQIKRGTAEEICEYTGNSRSIESAYLNQLHRQGYIQKERGKLDGENTKKMYFYI
jgi:DNA-binding MarR family transcriptional regulator